MKRPPRHRGLSRRRWSDPVSCSLRLDIGRTPAAATLAFGMLMTGLSTAQAETVIDMPPPPPAAQQAETTAPTPDAETADDAAVRPEAAPESVEPPAESLTPGQLALSRYALAREGARNQYFASSYGRSPYHHRSFVITYTPWWWNGWSWWDAHRHHPGFIIGGPICWW